MQVTFFTILVVAFLAFAVSRAYFRFRDQTISFRQFAFWALIWLSGGFVFLNPRISGDIAIKFGIGRGVDVIVYTSIIVLFYLAFRVYAALSVSQHEITRLVRAIALEEREREDQKK
jgi:hypothetical protein